MKKAHRSFFAVLACLLAFVFSVNVLGACGSASADHSDPAAQSKGSAWYYGASVPADSMGTNGDRYFNTTTLTSYIKEDQTWRVAENGEAGYLYSGPSAPDANIGSVNDFYINETSGELYQKKSQDSWGDPILTLKGEKGRDGVMWFSGEGAPSDVKDSIVGDFYLDTLNFDVYQKTGDGAWTPLGSIEGKAGTLWFHGKELPEKNVAAETAKNGDYYMRHFDPVDGYMGYQIYSKEAEGWEMIANCAACYTKGTSHEFGEDNLCKHCGLENVFTDPSYFDTSSETEDEVFLNRAPTDVEDVVVPGTMNGKKVSIGSNSFMANNTTVKSVTFESGITNIHQYAFRNCTNLETVNLPDTLESLEAGAFAGCSSLKSLTIPASVKEVKNAVFVYGSENSVIEEIIFEESGSKLEKLHFSAFQGCTKLKKLVLPEHSILYTSFGTAMNDRTYFLRDSALYADEKNWVDDGNGNKMLYINNHLIAAKVNATDKKIALNPSNPQYTTDVKSIGKLTIREGTHDIAREFLVGNSLNKTTILEEPLQIPDSVEIISSNTFRTVEVSKLDEGTRAWVKPVFGPNSKLRYIDSNAFYSAFGPNTNIVLPKTVEYIGKTAFGSNSYNFTFKLTTADNLKYIAADAFYRSTGLQGTEDNYGLYVGTDSDPYLILVKGTDKSQASFTVNEETKFILAAFSEAGYKITEFHIGSKVESIGSNALYGCSSLKSLTIPANVKRIEMQLLGVKGGSERNKDTRSYTIEGGGKWYYATNNSYPNDGILGEIPESAFVSPTEIGNMFIYYRGVGYSFSNIVSDWVRVTD